MQENLIFTGFSGTGKSRVGKIVAKMQSVKFIDIDQSIVLKTGKTISEIFDSSGEQYFRTLESQEVDMACSESGIVISTGGGTIIDERNYFRMKNSGVIVCLDAKPETIHKRLLKQKEGFKNQEVRPLLTGTEPITTIRNLKRQREHYYDLADFKIDTEKMSTKQVALQAIKYWNRITRER
ncbi:MAG: shikimate kinase [SAR202 cluster bacterium]|nr:shikimate kinase [SAR202 cluster bacterium]|tara:strand:+ start:597 stop:1139 length:543 start_codon:yes stop_codon:yes gene_type:complete